MDDGPASRSYNIWHASSGYGYILTVYRYERRNGQKPEKFVETMKLLHALAEEIFY
jgi:hypothetical protein